MCLLRCCGRCPARNVFCARDSSDWLSAEDEEKKSHTGDGQGSYCYAFFSEYHKPCDCHCPEEECEADASLLHFFVAEEVAECYHGQNDPYGGYYQSGDD